MKNLKKVVSSVLMFSFLIFNVSPLVVFATQIQEPKVNICHTSGNSGNWNVLNVDESAVQSHIDEHGDFLYEGPTQDGTSDDWCANNVPGDFCSEVAGFQESEEDCLPPPPPTPETATISAIKIVCDEESDLPNWGAGGPNITATTASDFLEENEKNCHQEEWTFEYGLNGEGGVSIPDNNQSVGGEGWTTFTSTATVPAGASYWVREQTQPGYVPFSGATSDFENPVSKNSAEIYCDEDVLNYDNYDYTRTTVTGQTYHCVAFNVPTEKPLACNPEVNLLANGSFETPTVSAGNYGIFAQATPGLEWLVDWVNALTGVPGLEIQDNVAGAPAAGAGDQFAELDGNHPVKISQDIPTIPGKEYQLSFKYSPRPGAQSGTNMIEARADGTLLGAVLSGVGGALTNWTSETRTFIADANTKIEFLDTDTDNSYGGYLDDVSLTCIGEPAPQCNEQASSVIVSNTDVKVTKIDLNGGETVIYPNTNAVAYTYIPGAWTTTIPGATWIWSENPVTDFTVTKEVTFEKQFIINGTPTGATLYSVGDDRYKVYVNGTLVLDDPYGGSYQEPVDVITIPGNILVSGINTIVMVVTNGAMQTNSFLNNPAGALFKIVVNNNECVNPAPQCNEQASSVIVSDTTTMVGANNALPVGFIHGAWAASIPGATWIWSDVNVVDATVDTTKTFTKTFPVVGTPLNSTLLVSADNNYDVFMNGIPVAGAGCSDITGATFGGAQTCIIPAAMMTTGTNTLAIKVRNWAVSGSDFNSNPAGLLYKLTLNNNECVTPEPTGSIEITKYICPANFVPNRTNNGVGSVAPEGCTLASDVSFGYVHGAQINANGPYPELDAPLIAGGTTAGNGKLVIAPVLSAGRYLIKETNPANLLGLYCEGDGDTNPNNNDNQELTFVPTGGVAHCVAYNKASIVIDENPAQCSDDGDNGDEEDNLVDANDPGCHTDGNVNNTESYDPNDNSESNGESAQCSDGISNDSDGLIDSLDPGCMSGDGGSWNPNDNDETNPEQSSRSSGGSSGSIAKPAGLVLGAETSCGIYVDKFIRKGYKNDVDAVKKIQKFLNDYMQAGIKEDGNFGTITEQWLKKFQVKHADKILNPWGFKAPTGIFYLTTQTEVNNIMCPPLNLPIPTLTPFETNPLSPKKD